jgi:shikimate dehydrogenase
MSEAGARAAGPDAERLLDAGRVQAYRGPSLVLFLGISTAGSLAHRTFPGWSRLFCPGAVMRGVDLPAGVGPAEFRELVAAMTASPCVLGAVVTSHKLRLFRACRDLLDHAEPLVALTEEIADINTRDGVRAFARDPQSLDIILDGIGGANGGCGPGEHGGGPGERGGTGGPRGADPRPVLCIGAGGSAIALMLAMRLDIAGTLAAQRPVLRTGQAARGPLTIVGRDHESLDNVRAVQDRCGIPRDAVGLLLAPSQDAAARHVGSAPPRTVVINATGLGKIEPGSPLPDLAAFPPGAVAWDFNYRGPLTFLDQARRAGVATEDGWDYFVAGWSAALAAITGLELTPELLSRAAESARVARPGRHGSGRC